MADPWERRRGAQPARFEKGLSPPYRNHPEVPRALRNTVDLMESLVRDRRGIWCESTGGRGRQVLHAPNEPAERDDRGAGREDEEAARMIEARAEACDREQDAPRARRRPYRRERAVDQVYSPPPMNAIAPGPVC